MNDNKIDFVLYDIIEDINYLFERENYCVDPIISNNLLDIFDLITNRMAKMNFALNPNSCTKELLQTIQNTPICLFGLFGYCKNPSKCKKCQYLKQACNKIDRLDIWDCWEKQFKPVQISSYQLT